MIPNANQVLRIVSASFQPDFVSKLAAIKVNFTFVFLLKNVRIESNLNCHSYFLFKFEFIWKINSVSIIKKKEGTSQQVVIRTCTVSKLLDSDSSYSSFSLKLDSFSEPLEIVSGLIASCKDDGNDSHFSLSFFLFLLSQL